MPGTDIREECDGNALPPCFLAPMKLLSGSELVARGKVDPKRPSQGSAPLKVWRSGSWRSMVPRISSVRSL